MEIVRRHTDIQLADELDNEDLQPSFLVDDFIYAPSTTLICSNPGVGKTHIALEIATSLITGEPLFTRLKVNKVGAVSYLLLESTFNELLRRIRTFRENIGFDTGLFSIDEAQGFDFSNGKVMDSYLRLLEKKPPNMVIVDTMSRLVRGSLKDDETASRVADFKDTVYRNFGCNFLFLHHLHRPKFDAKGNEIEEEDSFYGNIMLKAIFDSSYSLIQTDETKKDKPLFAKKKDRAEALPNKIQLYYDSDDARCHMADKFYSSDHLSRLIDFIEEERKTKKVIDTHHIKTSLTISPAHLRRLAKERGILDLVEIQKRPGQASLWEFKEVNHH